MRATPVMTGVIMPGGYHYEENGKMVVEEAASYEDLIAQLAQYRAANGLPLGDPQYDIDKYICSKFPNMCGGRMPDPEEGVDPIELSYGKPVKRTPRERVMQWAANRMHSATIEFVDKEVAENRAEICGSCPMRRPWNDAIEGCPGCADYVQQAEVNLFKIRAGRKTTAQIGGHMCDIAGHDLETACWLEEPALRHRRNYRGQFPDACWLKDLIQTQ